MSRPCALGVGLGALIFLSGCVTIVDLFAAGPWCDQARHLVVPGDSQAAPEPCWRSGVTCTLKNAVRAANVCENQQTLVLNEDANYVFRFSDPFFARLGPGASEPEPEERRIVAPISKNIVIEGNNASLIVDPVLQNLGHFFVSGDPARLELRNLTLVGGTMRHPSTPDPRLRGSALQVVNGGVVFFDNVIFKDHRGPSQGSVIFVDGSVTINDSRFIGNEADGLPGTARVESVSTVNCDNGALDIARSTFTGNESPGYAVYAIDCRATIARSTFNGNDYRAGVLRSDSTVNVRSSTISGNTLAGPAASARHGTLTAHDCTFAENSIAGPFAVFELPAGRTGQPVINTLLATVGGSPACSTEPSTTATFSGMATDGSCPGMTVISNPQLGPAQLNGGNTETHLPAARSPLVDAGADCLRTDQRGQSRRVNPCDVGSVER